MSLETWALIINKNQTFDVAIVVRFKNCAKHSNTSDYRPPLNFSNNKKKNELKNQ